MNKIIGFEFNNERFTSSTENEINNLLTFREHDSIVVICDSSITLSKICIEIEQMNNRYNGLLYATEDDKSVYIDEKCIESFTTTYIFDSNQKLILTTDKAYGFYNISHPEELWFASKNNQNTITIYAYTDFIDYKKYWDEGKTPIMLKEGRFI